MLAQIEKPKTENKEVMVTFSGDEARVFSLVLTEFVRNMSGLVMLGRIKRTAKLEKELVIISNALDKLASADFKLRASKEEVNSFGFSL